MKLENSKGYKQVINWLKANKRKPFKFQTDAWQYYAEGYSGLVNAPTGFGKTFSIFLAVVIDELNKSAEQENIELKGKQRKNTTGLKLIWITPLRSLAKEIGRASC